MSNISEEPFPSLSTAQAIGKKKLKNNAAQTAAFVPGGQKLVSEIPAKKNSATSSANLANNSGISEKKITPIVDLASKFSNRVELSKQKSMSAAHQKAINDNGTVRLPVDDVEEEICYKAMCNDILIVSGDTGSGKSTRTPTFLAKTLHHTQRPGMKIFITQPRRVAAISLAKRVGSELRDVDENGEPLFKRVGYAVGQDRHFDNNAEFVFCTCGWLLLKLLNDLEFSNTVSYLVVDEAHERDADMDLLLFVCKSLLSRFSGRFKLVLMSATLNYRAFEHYFTGKIDVVSINMRRFPVQIAHIDTLKNATMFFETDAEVQALNTIISDAEEAKAKEDPNGLFAGLGALCNKIYTKLLPGSATTILVFLSGIQEIDTAYDFVTEALGENAEICVLHSMIEQEAQMHVFKSLAPPKKSDAKTVRIILSTNIAESSVTIPDVSIVIDFGKQKTMQRSRDGDIMELRAVDISRAAADQRAGRTGRVCNGTVFRFYSEFNYQFFSEHNRSEIQDAPPATTILRFFSLKQNNATKMPELADPLRCISQLVDPPDQYDVQRAFNELVTLGALTDCESCKSSITPFGTMLVRLPLSFAHSEFVLFGCQFHAYSAHFAVIAAFLNNSDVWLNPNHKDQNQMRYQNWLRSTTASRQRFGLLHNSDLLAAIEIFRTMLSFDRRRGSQAYARWIDENGFHYNRIEQFMSVACDIISRLAECGFEGCKTAAKALFSRRYKNSALTQAQIDSILPMWPLESKICSLIVAWALSKNIIQTTTTITKRPTPESLQKERTKFLESLKDEKNKETAMERFEIQMGDRVACDFDRNETISLQVSLEVTGDIGNQTPDAISRRVVGACISSLNNDASKTTSTLESFSDIGKKWTSTGSVRFCPLSISAATHVLQQLLNRGSGTIHLTFGVGRNRLQCTMQIRSASFPEIFSWIKPKAFSDVRVYDYPPRSPLHCFFVCQKPLQTNVKKCFLPNSSTSLIAVAADFTLTGRSLRASLLSLVMPENRLLFSLVARFSKNANFNVQEHTNFLNQVYHRITTQEFACGRLKTKEDCQRAEELIGPLSDPIVAMLKRWTLEDITDQNRSIKLCSLLLNLSNSVLEN